jgi:Glycosyl transferases group 1
MRVLHFARLTHESPQWGLRSALRSIASEYHEFDWLPLWETGQRAELRHRFIRLVQEFRPSLIFAQIQTGGVLSENELRQAACPVVSWCGDLRETTPDWAWEVAPHAISCFSNLRDVDSLKSKGYVAHYLNIGVSLEVFCPFGEQRNGTPPIVFMGNNYGDWFPLSNQRRQMVELLQHRYGARFAVYGRGWGQDVEWLDEKQEAAAYRACSIAIGQNHFADVLRFASDRLFRAATTGAFVIHNHYPQIELDVTPGKHVAVWHNLNELCMEIDYYLDRESERTAIAAAGCAHVRQYHSWDTRMEDLRRILCDSGYSTVASWEMVATDPELEMAVMEWCKFPEAFNGDGFIAAELRRLVRLHGIKVAVETGCYEGKTTEALADMVCEVVTIESDDRVWSLSNRLDAFTNVRRIKGDSPKVLETLLPSLDRPILFYLDAHWGAHAPLLDELAAIAKAGLKPVISIHDFRNPKFPAYGFDTYDIGPYRWETIEESVRAIYGSSGWRHWYNEHAAGARRGIVYIEPADTLISSPR